MTSKREGVGEKLDDPQHQPAIRVCVAATILLLSIGLFYAILTWEAPLVEEQVFLERDRILNNFASMPSLENVEVIGHIHEGVYYCDFVKFSIKKIPNSIVAVNAERSLQYCRENQRTSISLHQLGHWTFFERGEFTSVDKNGISTTTPFYGESVALEPGTSVSESLPCKVESILDLVKNYETLLKHFDLWPRQDSPGVLKEKNRRTEFWVERSTLGPI